MLISYFSDFIICKLFYLEIFNASPKLPRKVFVSAFGLKVNLQFVSVTNDYSFGIELNLDYHLILFRIK